MASSQHASTVQGYLARPPPPSPQDYHRALDTGVLKDPKGRRFLMRGNHVACCVQEGLGPGD